MSAAAAAGVDVKADRVQSRDPARLVAVVDAVSARAIGPVVGFIRYRVATSLREAKGPRHFLSDFEIWHTGGSVLPVEYNGRCYAFSHVSAIGGYASKVRERIY